MRDGPGRAAFIERAAQRLLGDTQRLGGPVDADPVRQLKRLLGQRVPSPKKLSGWPPTAEPAAAAVRGGWPGGDVVQGLDEVVERPAVAPKGLAVDVPVARLREESTADLGDQPES